MFYAVSLVILFILRIRYPKSVPINNKIQY